MWVVGCRMGFAPVQSLADAATGRGFTALRLDRPRPQLRSAELVEPDESPGVPRIAREFWDVVFEDVWGLNIMVD